jgi:uncharacterized RDD family membrane protein YckC
MSFINIQTTQNIRLEYETAGIGERLIAIILDRLVWTFWVILWYFIVIRLHLKISTLLTVIIGAPVLFYSLYCELLFNGQSIGKRIMSIRVAKVDGTEPSFGDYFLRWIFRLIDISGVAIVCMMFTAKSQRLGDLVAGTCVIRIRNRERPIHVPKFPENYQVTYPAASLLTDHDVHIIFQIMEKKATSSNKWALKRLAGKVKEITRTESSQEDSLYLKTILSDYYYLAGKNA